MAKEIKSPKQDVAQKELIAVQNATTKIKEIIVSDIDSGVSKEETTKKIARIIADVGKDITDPLLLKEAKQTLALSTQKWYYEYFESVKAIRLATTRNINTAVARFKTPQLALLGKTYNIDIASMINEFGNANTNNQFKATVDKFRPFLDDATKGLPIIRDYDKLIKGQVKVLASNPPISNRVTKEGKPYKVNLRNRAEMFVRYEANKEDLQKLIADGVEYAWISTHADASPRCQRYQGKLYSLKNESGVINGVKYSPIEDALKGPLGDGNGCISGYNCRHRLIEYTPNSKPPNDYTQEEMKKAYAIDQKQRSYENRIRQLKTEERLMRASGDIETARKLRLQWRLMNKQYEIYSLENGRAYYTWRTIIRDDEVAETVPIEVLENDKVEVKGVPVNKQILDTTASMMYNNAKSIEPKITKDIINVTKDAGAYNAGLEFRLKDEKSLSRKIKTDYAELIVAGIDTTINEVAESIKDANRYTIILDHQNFVESYNNVNKNLTEKGYSVNTVKNTFKISNSMYKGVNNTYKDSEGNIFELQFHTKESFDLKNGELHRLYEEYRDVNTSNDRRLKLEEHMKKLTSVLTIPKDIDKI